MNLPLKLIQANLLPQDDRRRLVAKCAKALHMSGNEAALLSFYALQSSGFRPSVQSACKNIGASKSTVLNCRKRLVDHGVAAILNDQLILDWSRIRLFASLDPKMTGRNPKIAPVQTSAIPMNIADMLAMPAKDLVLLLAAMTDKEYKLFQKEIKKLRPVTA